MKTSFAFRDFWQVKKELRSMHNIRTRANGSFCPYTYGGITVGVWGNDVDLGKVLFRVEKAYT